MVKIVLSISKCNSAFDHLATVLGAEAQVAIVPLSGYSLKGADILIGKSLTAQDFSSADQLKAVFAYKTGVDDFPLSLLAQNHVILVNSHVESDKIAEYAFVLASTLCSHILPRDKDLRERGGLAFRILPRLGESLRQEGGLIGLWPYWESAPSSFETKRDKRLHAGPPR